ncbi:MAG: ATP-binding cassette domain-containing protein [Clostridia bacterium]|nr:ATP-binding cassette domain-containing protein [Clostridia bacterium]
MLLQLKNISFNRDNKQILDNINLQIDNNQFVAITGPNGSGKSTLAKIIMGIEKPDSGKILFNGQDITNFTITQRAQIGLGFAFQQPVKFKGLTVKNLIDIAAGKDLKLGDACEFLSQVGLCAKEYINREVDSNLSGGELKRIEIAMLTAKNSKLTIFDEPEAGIDLWSFNSLIQVFKTLSENYRNSLLIISHQERILNIADTIILLSDGKVSKIGSKDEVLPNILGISPSCKFKKEVIK